MALELRTTNAYSDSGTITVETTSDNTGSSSSTESHYSGFQPSGHSPALILTEIDIDHAVKAVSNVRFSARAALWPFRHAFANALRFGLQHKLISATKPRAAQVAFDQKGIENAEPLISLYDQVVRSVSKKCLSRNSDFTLMHDLNEDEGHWVVAREYDYTNLNGLKLSQYWQSKLFMAVEAISVFLHPLRIAENDIDGISMTSRLEVINDLVEAKWLTKSVNKTKHWGKNVDEMLAHDSTGQLQDFVSFDEGSYDIDALCTHVEYLKEWYLINNSFACARKKLCKLKCSKSKWKAELMDFTERAVSASEIYVRHWIQQVAEEIDKATTLPKDIWVIDENNSEEMEPIGCGLLVSITGHECAFELADSEYQYLMETGQVNGVNLPTGSPFTTLQSLCSQLNSGMNLLNALKGVLADCQGTEAC